MDIKKFAVKLKRTPESNKYDYGHVLVIAGSKNMPGAGVLCCNAAHRAGAGLVTYAVNENFLTAACAMSKPETMFFVYKNVSDMLKFIKARKVSSLIIGPGLETGKALKVFIEKIIFSADMPIVLDASGLAAFNGNYADLKKVKKLIITPHEGEFARLINKNIGEIKKDRRAAVLKFARDNSLICVLKGNKTLVSDGKNIYENRAGTPAMAAAGSGDVLSGVIAAFAGRAKNFFEAAAFAVFIHAKAGEISAKDKGINGVTASDIAENICYAMKMRNEE